MYEDVFLDIVDLSFFNPQVFAEYVKIIETIYSDQRIPLALS